MSTTQQDQAREGDERLPSRTSHDDLFREVFSDPGAQKDLIRVVMPELAATLNLDTIVAGDSSFTEQNQADLLLSVQDRRGDTHFVYFLVEHKSYHDPIVAIQLLRYAGAILQREWANRTSPERGPLPPLYINVLYQGADPWTTPLSLTELHPVSPGPARPHQLELTYKLFDLSTFQPENHRIGLNVLAALITMRYVMRRLTIPEARQLMHYLSNEDVDPRTRERLIWYYVTNTSRENTRILLPLSKESRYNKEGDVLTMQTMAQALEEQGWLRGLDEGKREGKLEGKREGKREGKHATQRTVARRMRAKGLPIDLIAETTELTPEEILALDQASTGSSGD